MVSVPMLVAQGAPADHFVPTVATPTLEAAVDAASPGQVIEVDAAVYRGEKDPVQIRDDLEIRGVNGKPRLPPLDVDDATVTFHSVWFSGSRLVTPVALEDLPTAVLGASDYAGWPVALSAKDAVIVAADVELSNAAGGGIVGQGSRVVVEGFSAHDFPAGTGIAIDDGHLEIRDGAFSRASFGAIGAEDSQVAIERVAFSDNRGLAGADLYVKGGDASARLEATTSVRASSLGDGGSIFAEGAALVLVDVRIEGASGDQGGAVYAKSVDLTVDGLVIVGALAGQGGGVYAEGGSFGGGSIDVTDVKANQGGFLWAKGADVSIAGLRARATPGGVVAIDGGVAWIEDGSLSIADADVQALAVAGDGAFVHAKGADVTLVRGVVAQVQADGSGGVVFVDGGSLTWTEGTARQSVARDGSVVHARDDAVVTLRDGWFEGNDARGKGTVHGSSGSVLTVERSRFCDNEAPIGAGLAIEGSRLTDVVTNTVFIGNTSSDPVAGATIAVLGQNGATGGSRVRVSQVDFVEEVAARSVVYTSGGRLQQHNSIFFGASPAASEDGAGSGVAGAYNLLHDPSGAPPDPGDAGGFASGPVLHGDPLFQGWSSGDCAANLWLSVGSPARDTGDPTVFDLDGSRSDVGAFGGGDAHLHDVDGDGVFEDTDCDDTDPALQAMTDEIPYDGIDQDCDGSDEVDVDGDGFPGWPAGGDDCDDHDALVNPAMVEDWYDGVDQDCDGNDDDRDLDGFAAVASGGRDCDDDDDGIHPGVAEVANDDVDQDCDGYFDGTRLAGSGGFGCRTVPPSGLGGVLVAVGALLRGRSRRIASVPTRIG